MKEFAAPPVTVEWDPDVRAVYLRMNTARPRAVRKTKRVAPGLLVDLDSAGNLIGIEILRPGVLHLVFRRVAQEYRVAGLKALGARKTRNRLEMLLGA